MTKKYFPLACLSLWGHHITLIDTDVKVTTWGVEKKKYFQWGLRLTISRRPYFGLSRNISDLINIF